MESTEKKALIVTTISGFVPQFEMKNVRILQDMGYEVYYATNYHTPVYTDNNDRLIGTKIVQHQIDFVRSPFRLLKHYKAYKQLSKLMRSQQFKLVHCHTPMGSVLARLAAKDTKTMPVIYTAHGFHFFRGAPLLNWVLFYPIEKFLAKYTDCLITMNEEDYEQAKDFTLRYNNEVYKINGVGVSVKEDSDSNNMKLKPSNYDFVLITVGELTKRKNQKVLLEAISQLKDSSIRLIICGSGVKLDQLKNRAIQLGIHSQVEFRGYCTDIKEHLMEADCFIFPSLQEGLPVALMEAMSVGLPVICSDVRGNKDLIQDGLGGYLVNPKDVQSYVEIIKELKKSKDLQMNMGKINKTNVQMYSDFVVNEQMKILYKRVLER